MTTDALPSTLAPFSPFPLTSEQCELVTLFEANPSVPALARVMRRDASAVSRQLQQLAAAAPVLEKRQGRWCLTPRGRQIAIWTHEAARSQRQILEASPSLRVVSTREFAARVLAPRLSEWIEDLAHVRVSLLAHEEGVESVLLAGRADVGFDCGRADDPDVRFRALAREPFAIVASPKVAAKVRGHKPGGGLAMDRLLDLPYLAYDRIRGSEVLGLSHEIGKVMATFNDIASTRAACVSGLGWTVLPAYAVRSEVERGELVALKSDAGRAEKFGVFWLRSRPAIAGWVRSAIKWLGDVSLTL